MSLEAGAVKMAKRKHRVGLGLFYDCQLEDAGMTPQKGNTSADSATIGEPCFVSQTESSTSAAVLNLRSMV